MSAAIIEEISTIIDGNCKDCKVAQIIQQNHGTYKKDMYCQRMCTAGKKLNKLGREIDFGRKALKGLELTEETYVLQKQDGLLDKEICAKYGISKKTLLERKRHWGLKYSRNKNMLIDQGKTKKDYLDMKLQDLKDREIAEIWGVSYNVLVRFKRELNINGGLEREHQVEALGKTTEDYFELKNQGLADTKIADTWGISRKALYNWRNWMGIKSTLKLENRTKEEYLELKQQNKTDREIWAAWGVSVTPFRKWKKAQGLKGGLKL